MSLVSEAVHGITVGSRAQIETSTDFNQLSAVAAFSVVGICLSLITLALADAGPWLLAAANGF